MNAAESQQRIDSLRDRERVAGIDEVGRGPLAGPVIAAAVILDPDAPVSGLADSKALTASRREVLAAAIKSNAAAWAIGRAEVAEIDSLNILHASLLAMRRAMLSLPITPYLALVDGNRCPELPCRAEAIIGGDAIVAEISAASIIAKVARDAEMTELDTICPGYGFARHKGYPTRQHLESLQRHGASSHHRHSFAPVRRIISSTGR